MEREKPTEVLRARPIVFILPVFRAFAISAAVFDIFLGQNSYSPLVAPGWLLAILSANFLFDITFRLLLRSPVSYSRSALAIDILLSLFIAADGGLRSPFLIYTLVPVVTGALFSVRRLTAGFSSILVALMAIVSFGPPESPVSHINRLLFYSAAVCLCVTLPYMANAGSKQNWQKDGALAERKRLSREIHDGAAQTASALKWQVELVRRQLNDRNINFPEMLKLESLAEKTHRDIRECLELLRNRSESGFLPRLTLYLEQLKQDTGIVYRVESNISQIDLENSVQSELLRICQEALNNVKKHARARQVVVGIRKRGKQITVSVSDDGVGFTAAPRENVAAYGLEVMKERAHLIGGRFNVKSRSGQGVEVQVVLPLASKI